MCQQNANSLTFAKIHQMTPTELYTNMLILGDLAAYDQDAISLRRLFGLPPDTRLSRRATKLLAASRRLASSPQFNAALEVITIEDAKKLASLAKLEARIITIDPNIRKSLTTLL